MRSLLPSALLLLALVAQPAAPQAPPPPPVAAKSWLLLDFNADQAIAGQAENERSEPASLTKLMSAYLVFEALREKRIAPDQAVPVSNKAWRMGGARTFIEPRRPVTVEELLSGMIVQSGNDATVALAELVAGSEEVFVQLMNRTAKRLGMKDTNFVNATGWPDPDHYSTARDLATLAAALIRDFPGRYQLYALKEFRYNNITQQNRNRLLWLDPNVDGVKTGHTEAAGYCLIASAKRGQRRLISVVLGTKSDGLRTQESQKLLNYGFQFYDSVRLYEKEQPISTLRVWKGDRNEVKAGLAEDLYMVLPKGDAEKIKAELVSRQPLIAPVSAGQPVGTVRLTLDGKPMGEHTAVALETVPIAGMFGRLWDTMRLWFN
ncbi:MAG: D-alanyl-D-alanine carboxypeptidase [Burkholderiales bacterium]|nr:D-alanyl-D-alanine carboxypeptidase [Burkholderiales bacterium]